MGWESFLGYNRILLYAYSMAARGCHGGCQVLVPTASLPCHTCLPLALVMKVRQPIHIVSRALSSSTTLPRALQRATPITEKAVPLVPIYRLDIVHAHVIPLFEQRITIKGDHRITQ